MYGIYNTIDKTFICVDAHIVNDHIKNAIISDFGLNQFHVDGNCFGGLFITREYVVALNIQRLLNNTSNTDQFAIIEFGMSEDGKGGYLYQRSD